MKNKVSWSVSFAVMKQNHPVDNALNASVQWFMDQTSLQAVRLGFLYIRPKSAHY